MLMDLMDPSTRAGLDLMDLAVVVVTLKYNSFRIRTHSRMTTCMGLIIALVGQMNTSPA
jgi:hypothetical protein